MLDLSLKKEVVQSKMNIGCSDCNKPTREVADC